MCKYLICIFDSTRTTWHGHILDTIDLVPLRGKVFGVIIIISGTVTVTVVRSGVTLLNTT